jgi:hypothetical protein
VEKISSVAGLKNAIQVLEVQQRIKGHIGASANKFRKLVGNVLQFGMTNFITQNSDQIKAIGQVLFQHFFFKKEKNSKKDSGSKENN